MKSHAISELITKCAGHTGLVTLMYHGVFPGRSMPEWPYAVSYEAFCKQLDMLSALGWKSICARDVEKTGNSPSRTVCITFDDGYANNYAAFEALAERGMCANFFIVSNDVDGRSSWPGEMLPFQPMLSSNQLREMSQAGMEICSHTLSHCKLTEADEATIVSELTISQQRLSDIIDKPVTSFAYPYGFHDTRIVNATRKAGYRVAFTAISGFGLVENDVLRARRITIFSSDDLDAFARKLLFGLLDVSWGNIGNYFFERFMRKIRSLIYRVKKGILIKE